MSKYRGKYKVGDTIKLKNGCKCKIMYIGTEYCTCKDIKNDYILYELPHDKLDKTATLVVSRKKNDILLRKVIQYLEELSWTDTALDNNFFEQIDRMADIMYAELGYSDKKLESIERKHPEVFTMVTQRVVASYVKYLSSIKFGD